MQIHTFGDSHSAAGWERITNINVHHLGSILAYSFGRDGLSRTNIAAPYFNVNEGDIVIFCFGEIDCRGHVHKHLGPEKTYKQIIDEIIVKYFKGIDENVKQFNKLNVCVYNVVPPIEKEKTAVEFQKQNPEWPFLGTNEERLQYVRYFNSCLAEECKKRSYIFIDIYEKYADENGFLNGALSDGITHIKDPVYLMDFMNDYYNNLLYNSNK